MLLRIWPLHVSLNLLLIVCKPSKIVEDSGLDLSSITASFDGQRRSLRHPDNISGIKEWQRHFEKQLLLSKIHRAFFHNRTDNATVTMLNAIINIQLQIIVTRSQILSLMSLSCSVS